VTTVIESFGLTSLVRVGNNYFLFDGLLRGPCLEFNQGMSAKDVGWYQS